MSIQQVANAPVHPDTRAKELLRIVQRINIWNKIGSGILLVIALLVIILFVGIIIYLLLQGGTYLFTAAFYSASDMGVGREIFNTFYILILAEVFSLPVAIASAIFLTEYSRQGSLVTIAHFAAETLAGVPSIVMGLFGVLAFSTYAHLGTSRLAGALTLLCLNLPLALRLFEDALLSVPREMREGGLALGATKWYMIRTVVIPSALPGIVTATILTAGKIVGEAAALLYTMGLNNPANVFTPDPSIASDTLTTHLYFIAGPGAGSTSLTTAQETTITAGSATLLIVLLLIINIVARVLGRYIQRRVTAA